MARVVRTAYQDPTTDGNWSTIDVTPLVAFARPVTLATIKATPALAGMQLVRKSRISVVPIAAAELKVLLRLGATKV